MTHDDQDVDDDILDEDDIIEEEYADMSDTGFRGPEFAAGLLLGAALGAVVALLAAPQAGARTRKDLGRKARKIRGDVEHRWDDAERALRRQVRQRKRKIRGQVDKVAKRTRKAVKRLT